MAQPGSITGKKRAFGLFVVFAAIFIASALFGALIRAAAPSEGPVKVIVYVKEGAHKQVLSVKGGFAPASVAVNSRSVLASIPGSDISARHSFSSFDGFTATVSRTEYERLKGDPNLEVHEAETYRIMLDGSAPLVNATLVPGLIYNGSNITGNTVSVCVLDTGINYGHAALGGCTTAQFLAGTCAKVPSGYDYVNLDNDPYDDHGHGSHVAGIVASTDSTYRGIAPNASIIAVKVCDSLGSCGTDAITSGIDWCVNNASRFNISVISLSLGSLSVYSSYCDGSSSFTRPIDDAVANNISVVVAAGNAGSTAGISDPACVKNATAVGSTTKSDGFSEYNRNNITDLLAPGSSITSVNYQGGFESLSGTSMATPHVSGAIALLSQYKKLTAGMNLSPYAAFLALNTTGVNITDTGGSGIQFARVSVYKALLSLDTIPPNLTIVAPTLANSSNSSSANVYVNITSNEVLQNASLEWNNNTRIINYSMNGSGLYWFRNHSSSSSGVITYRVWGNDSGGKWGVSENRTIYVNNTPPSIDLFLPANINHNITEPSDQTFNITFTATFADKPVTVDWYVNGTLQVAARNTNFTFLGNFSQALQMSNGTYNITAVVSDDSLSSQINWTLTVNNTNRAPQWANASNQTSAEDNPLNFTVVATDLDNDSITYFLNNTVNFTINSSSGNITFNLSGAGNFSGVFYLALNASDGVANASTVIFVNITPVNDTPVMFLISNLTVNVTDFANITAIADDAENDILNFTVNDTFRLNFTGSNRTAANFSWKTNISDYGDYGFSVNVTDFGTSSLRFFNVTVIARADFNGNGIPDIYEADLDGDGIPDANDSISGNISFVNSSTLPASGLNVTINGSTNTSQLLNGTFLVNVTNGSRVLAEFYWNFSLGSIFLNFSVDVQPSSSSVGYTVIRGLVLQQNQTKNITVDIVSGTDRVCIKDADVSSISDVSSGCTGSNETLISCPGVAGKYNCSVIGSQFYKITNVSFTAAREQPASSPILQVQNEGSSSSGGGGGGGGSSGFHSENSLLQEVLALGDTGKFAFTKVSDIAVEEIVVESGSTAVNPSITVRETALASTVPLPVSREAGKVYKYLSIVKSNLESVRKSTIRFAVPNSWFVNNSLDSSTVLLNRLVSGSWEELPTTAMQFSSEAGFTSYVATTEGFSIFAITAGKIAARPVPSKNETQATAAKNVSNISASPAANISVAGNEPVQSAAGKVNAWLVVLALLLIFAAAAALIIRAPGRFRKVRK